MSQLKTNNLNDLISEIINISCNEAKASIPDRQFGHIAINAPIVLSKKNKSSPKDEFDIIAPKIASLPGIKEVNFMNGFCNIILTDEFILSQVQQILAEGDLFGYENLGQKQKVNIEYVSANPTGPMHLGHLRGLYADVLANLLQFFNYDVTREYFINDAGNQVRVLGESVRYEYCKLHGIDCTEPSERYPGAEVKMIAASLVSPNLENLDYFTDVSISKMLEYIKSDLDLLNVHFDFWRSEKTLHENGLIDEAVAKLEALGAIKLGVLGEIKGKKGAASNQPIKVFENEKAVTKAHGPYTYFGADLGYVYDKIQRGFDWIIYCVGSDQGPQFEYVIRAGKLLSPNTKISAIYFQSVDMIQNGERAKFSKRGGVAVRPSELNLPDVNILRYMMESRKNDTHFSINIDKMREISMHNMFYYVQYAHARASSILRNYDEDTIDVSKINPELITPSMMSLAYKLIQWPREMRMALNGINSIVTYVEALSSMFHAIWTEGNEDDDARWITENDEINQSRKALVKAFKQIMGFALRMLGIKPYDKI